MLNKAPKPSLNQVNPDDLAIYRKARIPVSPQISLTCPEPPTLPLEDAHRTGHATDDVAIDWRQDTTHSSTPPMPTMGSADDQRDAALPQLVPQCPTSPGPTPDDVLDFSPHLALDLLEQPACVASGAHDGSRNVAGHLHPNHDRLAAEASNYPTRKS